MNGSIKDAGDGGVAAIDQDIMSVAGDIFAVKLGLEEAEKAYETGMFGLGDDADAFLPIPNTNDSPVFGAVGGTPNLIPAAFAEPQCSGATELDQVLSTTAVPLLPLDHSTSSHILPVTSSYPPPSSSHPEPYVDPAIIPQTPDELARRMCELHTENAQTVAAWQLLCAYTKHHNTSIEEVHHQLADHKVDVGAIKEVSDLVLKCLDSAGDGVPWTKVSDGELQLFYHHIPGTSIHSIKGACKLDCPLLHLLALVREFDLVKSWNKYVVESAVLSVNGVASILIYASFWLPWPFPHADLLVNARGVDLLDSNGCILLTAVSPEECGGDVNVGGGEVGMGGNAVDEGEEGVGSGQAVMAVCGLKQSGCETLSVGGDGVCCSEEERRGDLPYDHTAAMVVTDTDMLTATGTNVPVTTDATASSYCAGSTTASTSISLHSSSTTTSNTTTAPVISDTATPHSINHTATEPATIPTSTNTTPFIKKQRMSPQPGSCIILTPDLPNTITTTTSTAPKTTASYFLGSFLRSSYSSSSSSSSSSTTSTPQPVTHAVGVAHMDTHMKFIPGFVVKFVLSIMAPFFFYAVKKMLQSSFKNTSGELPSRIQSNPALYDMMGKRVEEHLQKKASQANADFMSADST